MLLTGAHSDFKAWQVTFPKFYSEPQTGRHIGCGLVFMSIHVFIHVCLLNMLPHLTARWNGQIFVQFSEEYMFCAGMSRALSFRIHSAL